MEIKVSWFVVYLLLGIIFLALAEINNNLGLAIIGSILLLLSHHLFADHGGIKHDKKT